MLLEPRHEEWRMEVRAFVEEHVAPWAKAADREDHFPREAVDALATKGWLGLRIPTEYGGSWVDDRSYTIFVEELSRVCGSTSITVLAHVSLGAYPIVVYGSEEQKKKHLPDLASGKKLAAFGLSEPDAGSDAAATRTTAVRDGDEWVINGTKCWITNGGVADVFVISARTTPDIGPKGISNFIIERSMSGFEVGKHEDKMGLRGSSTTMLHFSDLRVPHSAMLGDEGAGFRQFMETLDGGRIIIGVMALGLAQGAYEKALTHATAKRDSGPMIKQQSIAFKLADMATKLEASRLMVYDAAARFDAGIPITKEAAMAKLFASEAATEVCTDAIGIIGADDLDAVDVDRFWRDARLDEIGEGTSEVQRLVILRIIARPEG
jgi:butyryl-CoA dehydrogenase